MSTNLHRMPKDASKSEDFWYRFIGEKKFIFSKSGTYFNATMLELQGLQKELNKLLLDGPKDSGWHVVVADLPKVTCSCPFALGDTDMSICSSYQEGGHAYCADCCHDKDCAVHF